MVAPYELSMLFVCLFEGRKLYYPSRALARSFPGPRFPHLTNEPDNPFFSTSPVAGEPNSIQVRNGKGVGAGTGEGAQMHSSEGAPPLQLL